MLTRIHSPSGLREGYPFIKDAKNLNLKRGPYSERKGENGSEVGKQYIFQNGI